MIILQHQGMAPLAEGEQGLVALAHQRTVTLASLAVSFVMTTCS